MFLLYVYPFVNLEYIFDILDGCAQSSVRGTGVN